MKPVSSPTHDESAWFERWFNEDYLLVYPHRDQHEATTQVASALALINHPVADCLDLGCGSGRHARALAANGRQVCAIDLSSPLLRAAIGGTETGARFIRSDIRSLPFRDCSFDLLSSFFTSFGYFGDDAEHSVALVEWRRVLRPHRSMLLDLPDRETTIARIDPMSERTLADGRTVVERRSLSPDGRRVEKSIVIGATQENRQYQESVRLFSEMEILTLVRGAGFVDARRVHDVPGFGERMVVIARRGEQ